MKKSDFIDSNGLVQSIETDTGIYGLFGKYRPLSNYHLEDIVVDGLTFKTSEAAYMAQKTDSLVEKRELVECTSGIAAKRLG